MSDSLAIKKNRLSKGFKTGDEQKITTHVLINGIGDHLYGATKSYVVSQLEAARATASALLISLEDAIDCALDPDFVTFFEDVLPANNLTRVFGPRRYYSMLSMINNGLRFQKNTPGSIVFADFLQQAKYLPQYDIASVHLYGVLTSTDILSNAIVAQAALPGVPIYVHSRGCADADPELHEAALASIRHLSIKVV